MQIPGVLDDLYRRGHVSAELGLSFARLRLRTVLQFDLPSMRVWAPTATAVALRIDPPVTGRGAGAADAARPERGVDVAGAAAWFAGATYAYDVTVYVPSAGRGADDHA